MSSMNNNFLSSFPHSYLSVIPLWMQWCLVLFHFPAFPLLVWYLLQPRGFTLSVLEIIVKVHCLFAIVKTRTTSIHDEKALVLLVVYSSCLVYVAHFFSAELCQNLWTIAAVSLRLANRYEDYFLADRQAVWSRNGHTDCNLALRWPKKENLLRVTAKHCLKNRNVPQKWFFCLLNYSSRKAVVQGTRSL